MEQSFVVRISGTDEPMNSLSVSDALHAALKAAKIKHTGVHVEAVAHAAPIPAAKDASDAEG